jgi:WD40 repeat protein
VLFAELSVDQNRIITASGDGTAKIWDKRQSPLLFEIYNGATKEVDHFLYAELSQNAKRALAATDTGKIKVWELAGSQMVYNLEAPEQCCSVAAWNANENQLAVARERTATVLDLATGETRFVVQSPTSIAALQFSPDGALLAIGSNNSCAQLLDTRKGTIRRALNGNCGNTSALAFSSDGHLLVSAGDGRKLVLWDIEKGVELLTISDFKGAIRSLAFSPDNLRFVTASRDKRVVIWHAQSGRALVNFQEAKSANVNSVQFSRDGSLVLTADVLGSTIVWDSATGRLLSRYSRGTFPLLSARFSHDGTRALAVNVSDIMVWDTGSDRRAAREVSEYVRCRAPFRIESGNLVQTDIDQHGCER